MQAPEANSTSFSGTSDVHFARDAELMQRLRAAAQADQPIQVDDAAALFDARRVPLDELLEIASLARERHFGKSVQVHILNNVRNGFCPEDCGYCAQRKSGPEGIDTEIAAYPAKSEGEILEEARAAYESGAYRYCLVTAGRGPSAQNVRRFAELIRKIKSQYPLQICLSAGLVTKPELAQELAEAGLDRYNHNLNTSESHYAKICSTHDYADRVNTLQTMHQAGVSLCSGVIAGMGESHTDLVEVAAKLSKLGAPSIPVNFFLPIPGHAVESTQPLDPNYCLRVLCMFRLLNPRAEIRMAAGRERHLGREQGRGLLAANSLFVSGYLNVAGSDAAETYAMIQAAGYEVDAADPEFAKRNAGALVATGAGASANGAQGDALKLKDLDQLRPFRER